MKEVVFAAQTILQLMCSSDPPASHSQFLGLQMCGTSKLVFCLLVLSVCYYFLTLKG